MVVTVSCAETAAFHTDGTPLAGIAKADETYFLRRFKGISTRFLDGYFGRFRALDRSPGLTPQPASLLAQAVRA